MRDLVRISLDGASKELKAAQTSIADSLKPLISVDHSRKLAAELLQANRINTQLIAQSKTPVESS
jgi:hypothetical protein